MLKLVVSDGRLLINDGKIVLSRWVSESYYGKVVILDSNSIVVASQKVSAANPIETHVGERTSAADVIGDVGANFKSGAFLGYYQSVMIGSTLDIVEKEGLWYYKNYGIGLSDADIQIKKTKIATFDGTAYLECDYDLDLYGITITTFTGTSTPSINGTAIEFTAGTAEYLKLSNGAEYWFQESDGVEIYNRNGDKVGLFAAVSGNGTLNVTSQLLPVGTSVSIEATPDPEHELDRVDITDAGGLTQITLESFNWVIDSATTMVAYFQAIFQVIQDVFSTAPIKYGKYWVFQNEIDLPSLKNYNLIFGVDSVTASITCGTDKMYPQLCTTNLNTNTDFDFTYNNSGVGGYSTKDFYDNYLTLVTPYISGERENILVLFGFANAGVENLTAQEKNDYLELIVNQAHIDGLKTLVMTATGADSAALQTQIEDANDILRANNSYSDYFYDLAAVPTLSPLINPTTTCDSVHPNSDTKQLIADSVSGYIETILPSFDVNNSVNILNTKIWKTNGIDERASIANNTSLTLGLNDFTIRAKVKIENVTSRIIVQRAGSLSNWWELLITEDEIYLYTKTKIFNAGVKGNVSNYNRIIDVVLVRSGSELKYYIDGKYIGINIDADVDITTPYDIAFASYQTFAYSANEYYEIQIFNKRALTNSEIYKLYLNESIDMTNCVLNPDFNFGLGSILYDKSPEGNNMTVTSSTPDTMFIEADEQPNYYTKGGTLFQRNYDGKFAIATYNNNGIPNLAAITGFTKVDDFPAGSGILKGLPNTYDGLQITGLETGASFEDIHALENSSTIEITKDDNTVSRLKVKQ